MHTHEATGPVPDGSREGTILHAYVRRMCSMNSRRLLKPIVAAILSVGLLTLGVAPADAATKPSAPTLSKNDTGWGIR